MKIKEIRVLPKNQLIKELSQLREQIRDLRFKIHAKEVKNNHLMKALRKDVARIMTVLKQNHEG
jgi:large subunit ribosomal protein L29